MLAPLPAAVCLPSAPPCWGAPAASCHVSRGAATRISGRGATALSPCVQRNFPISACLPLCQVPPCTGEWDQPRGEEGVLLLCPSALCCCLGVQCPEPHSCLRDPGPFLLPPGHALGLLGSGAPGRLARSLLEWEAGPAALSHPGRLRTGAMLPPGLLPSSRTGCGCLGASLGWPSSCAQWGEAGARSLGCPHWPFVQCPAAVPLGPWRAGGCSWDFPLWL